MQLFLATTCLEETWRPKDKTLFLGNWCLNPSRRKYWENLNYEVAPYHWDDMGRLKADEAYLEGIYERVLDDLVVILNEYHGLNWDRRAWTIMVGEWLRRYITILYDRYSQVHTTLQNHNISAVYCGTVEYCQLTPLNRNMFYDSYKNDTWNYYLFSRIIKDTTSLSVINKEIEPQNVEKMQDRTVKSFKKGAKQLFRSLIASRPVRQLNAFLSRNNLFYVYLPYLPRRIDEIRLNLAIGNFPFYFNPESPELNHMVDKEARKGIHLPEASGDRFENYLRELLPEFLPVVYWEKLVEIFALEEASPFPKKIRCIFTTIGIYTNDVFKVWVVKQIMKGSTLLIGQHGGEYANLDIKGEALPLELAASDCYFSWGWTMPGERIKPVPAFISVNQRVSPNPNREYFTVITRPLYKYCCMLSSGSLPGRKNVSYLELVLALTGKLADSHSNALLIKLHPSENNEAEQAIPLGPQLLEKYPFVQLSSSSESLLDVFSLSKLNIFTYDGTSFLQGMALDVPCILISGPETDPFSELSDPFYRVLEDAGIYHATVNSAYDHILSISDDINRWWASNTVREARQSYCEMFTRVSRTPLADIANALKDFC